ncbi:MULTISPECIES: NlpC/P60 family protein [Alphaproteobacteria]|uniref:Peptidase n=2 Tax=Alphaproteobacteria TaxID=28211 RepID=A0A512HG15_9HYPH|nr:MULTISPECIES: NlpC/P60 family protein [Alphaproteobacteria]GEO84387.1 peptidase [Ciceribacter naphthalenivorans]GLR22350.1 peptidase [Ciceribacter naphthalenivorans]GLT05206.1 peptidase [Sphingomonas psychrolutea]
MSVIAARVVAIAETWIGTPYRHQASTRGVGCDCLGLVRGIWREIYGVEPEPVAPYAPDWAERSGKERLLEAAGRHCAAVQHLGEALPGDLVIFRFRQQFAAKHAGILAAPDAFIHAYEQAAVIRSALVPAWSRRIAGIYRFPEI